MNFVANYGGTNYFVNFVVDSFDRSGRRQGSKRHTDGNEMRTGQPAFALVPYMQHAILYC